MSIEDIQREAEIIVKTYPYCNGGVFLDATAQDRPDFIGGNCFEHAHRLAAAVGGCAIATPVNSKRIHAAYLTELDGKKYFCDTSMALSVLYPVGEDMEHRLPFNTDATPAWFNAEALEGERMEFTARQSYYPLGCISRYVVDFSEGCTETFIHRVLSEPKRDIKLIAQDVDGVVQLEVTLDGLAKISGRETTEWGPSMRRSGNESPLLERMGRCLEVSPREVREVLHSCASAYRQWHQLN